MFFVRAVYIHVWCCWCSFAFAWILTVVSLCLTLRYMSNTVWVHNVVSIISNDLRSLFVFLLPSPIQQPHSPAPVPFVSCIILIFHCCLITVFSTLPLLLYLIPPSPQRSVLSLPNVRWLAEAAEPAGPARLGAVPAAFEAGSCLRRSVPGCQLCLSTGLRSHRGFPGSELSL